MALDVGAVRAGIRSRLEAGLGGEVQVITSPDQLTPPCLLIGMPEMEYDKTFGRGVDVMRIPIHAILPRTHDQAAVDLSDAWISGAGHSSLITILYQDRTYGGSCSTSRLIDALPEFWPGGSGELPSYQWTLEVHG